MTVENGGAVAPETNALPTAGNPTEATPSVPHEDGAGGEPQESANPWDAVEEAGDWKGVPMGARKRIQKLSADKRELREMMERQERMIRELVGHVQSSQPELKREDFATEDEYIDYRMEQRERKKNEERQRQVAEERARQAPVQRQAQEWIWRVEAAKKDLPDYESVVFGAGLQLDPQAATAIYQTDVGPHVLYAIAKTDGLALAMEDMSPAERVAVVRKMEARVREWRARAFAAPAAAQPVSPVAPSVIPPAAPAQMVRGNAVPPPPPKAGVRAASAQSGKKNWIEERNERFGFN